MTRLRFVEIAHRSDDWKGCARNYRRLNQGPFGTGPFTFTDYGVEGLNLAAICQRNSFIRF